MFNVGDIVRARVTEFTVTGIEGDRVTVNLEGQHHGTFGAQQFTLVTPATPKLTGMTQFFKDMKEKQHETSI